jgi:hypothetical protein
MFLTWTLRLGLVIRRESIPLSHIHNLRRGTLAVSQVGYRGDFVRISDDEALFATPPDNEAAFVTKGGVVIKGGNANIVYRASIGPILFLILWFGLLIAGEVGIWFLPEPPLWLALALFGMMAVAALMVRHTVRLEVGILRGIAVEAVIRLRDTLRAGPY